MRTDFPTEQALSPFAWYRYMRESMPIFYEESIRSWHLFRYDDILQVITDHTTFSSDRKRILPQKQDQAAIHSSIISMDQPRHKQLRNVVNQAFSPQVVMHLTTRITSIINELLDTVVSNGGMDVIKDFASPLPVLVLADLLGIPAVQRDRLKRWTEVIVSREYHDAVEQKHQTLNIGAPSQSEDPHPLHIRSVMQEMREMDDYFLQLLQERQHHLGYDLISRLLAVKVDGEPFSQNELLGLCASFLIAGSEVTAHLLGNAILCFDEYPEVLASVRHHPSLIPMAIEEVLRYRSPLKSMIRIAAIDTKFGHYSISKNQVIILWLASANHDETHFPHPEQFDIQRKPNRHLGFGHGIHYCIGAVLARLEIQIALRIMLERFPAFRRAPGTHLEPIRSGTIFGVKHLPIVFS